MKKFLIGLVVAFATIIVILVAILLTFDLNKYKPQIEQKVYEATGKELKINGDIGLSLSPFGLSVKDIEIKNPKGFSSADMLKLNKVAVSLQIAPLLSKQLKVNYVKLKDLDLLVEKSKKGLLNLSVGKKSALKEKKSGEQTSKEEGKLPMVNVGKVLLENVNIKYIDHQAKSRADVNALNLTVNDITLNGDKDILKALSLKGLLKIASIKYDKYKLKNISAHFKFANKTVTIDPMQLTTFNSTAKGKLIYKIDNKNPKTIVGLNIGKLNLVALSKEFIKSKKISLDGYAKTDIRLSMVGSTPKRIKRTLNGDIFVEGNNFGIKGVDLNKVIKSLDDAKSINKKDVAGFLLAGPVGLALSKGVSGGKMLSGFEGGTTAVKKMVIKTHIKNGIVSLNDVAMKIGHNIIAAKGTINLYKERLKLKVGILGSNKCLKISEDIGGTFTKPKYSTKALTSGVVKNTVSSLLGGLGGIMPNNSSKKQKPQCKSFYNGSIK